MRPLVLIILLTTIAGRLHAQDDDPRMHQILYPDLNLGTSYQNKTFYSGGTGAELTKDANVKEFYFVQKYSPKTFETKEFAARDYWQGDFQFTTKAATVKTNNQADKAFDTKSAPVKDAHETGKDYATQAFETREADEKGKTSQSHLDEVYKGKSELNMDQVRDLLNKSH